MISDRLNKLQRHVRFREGERKTIRKQISVDQEKVARKTSIVEDTSRAIEVLQAATETRRAELHDKVEQLVTRGLRAVFRRDDFEFFFKTSLAGGRFGISPMLRSEFNGKTMETSIVDGHGGGVADLVSFLLRVIVLSLSRPRIAPVLILDESFRHVSPEYLRGAASLLRELSKSAGIQFILVTHKPELLDCADVIYRASQKDHKTIFKLEHRLRDESFHARPKRGEQAPEQGSSFDHLDLGAKINVTDEEMRISTTADFAALRHRAARPKKRKKRNTK